MFINDSINESLDLLKLTIVIPQVFTKAMELKLSNSLANAKKETKYRRPTEVHHIVAQSASKAFPARWILSQVGININNYMNLIEIDTAIHRRLHQDWYYTMVNVMLYSAYYSASGNKAIQTANVEIALFRLRAFIEMLNATYS